jgi:hypothetical protein
LQKPFPGKRGKGSGSKRLVCRKGIPSGDPPLYSSVVDANREKPVCEQNEKRREMRRIHACHTRRIDACYMRRRIHACHIRRRIHARHTRRIHACHMRRRIDACYMRSL